MIPMSLSDIARAIGAETSILDNPFPQEGVVKDIRRVTTDSRDVRPGDLFFALRGERFDGHRFVGEASAKGALACVCACGATPAVDTGPPVPLLWVENTVAALGRLAAHYRRSVMSVGTVVVAVTGSNGKTTTKCMIDHVLGGSLRGRASPKSFNNHIGVPLTLLSADADDRYLVVEVGTSAPGEIASLAAMASPDAAVITSIGEAHLQGLGSLEDVAAEKASLLQHVRPGGFAVVNIDQPEIRPQLAHTTGLRVVTVGTDVNARLRVADRRSSIDHTTFTLDGRFTVELPMPGAHHAMNAAAAFAVARWLGIACEQIIERLRTFVPPEGRTRRFEIGDLTLIDDAYNANPASVVAAIEALCSAGSARRVLVLGDMLELGGGSGSYHVRMVKAAVEAGIEVLIAVGPMTAAAARSLDKSAPGTQVYPCDNAQAACAILDVVLAPGDTVWVKASRGMRLDRVVGHLQARSGVQAAVA